MIYESFKRLREETPNASAFLIASGDRSVAINWRQFTDDIDIVVRLIREYAPGAKIALLGENSYEWMVAHAAILFAGGTVVPIDMNLNAPEIAQRLRFVGARALIYSSLYEEKAKDVGDQLPGVVVAGFGSLKTERFLDKVRSFFTLKDSIWSNRARVADNEMTSMIVFTSGTTSEPRGVELTIKAIETFIRSSELSVPMNFGERSLMLLPLNHIYGICVAYMMLVKGVALGVCPDFRRIYDAFERFRVNFAFLVPALADLIASKIAKRGASAEEALGQPLNWICTGGAPLARRTYEELTALGVKTLCAYGLTETCACFSMSCTKDAPHPCSAGKASQLLEVETKVSPEGELMIRGPNVMKGYYKRPEKTAAVLDDEGWFHTGDRGRIDSDGYVWVEGRASRTIVLSSGKKVAPEELEDKLMLLPGVLEALVSGEGESREIKAEVYASVSEEAVRQIIGEFNLTLPVYQRIHTIVVRKEPFVRTTSGKIKLEAAKK